MKRLFVAAAVFVFAVTAQAGSLANAPSVAAIVEALENPRLGASVTVQNVSFSPSANMSIKLESGSVAPVTAAGDVIGLFFTGNGRFTYTSTDKIEAVNVKTAAKKRDVTLSESNGNLVMTGPFEQLFLRGAAIALPDLKGAAGSDMTAAFNEHRESMSKLFNDPTMHLLAKQILDMPAAPFAAATMTGKGNPYGYVLDTVEEKSEALYVLTREPNAPNRELAKLYWPVLISEQPVGRSRKDFLQPNYLLTHLDYTLEADDQENAKLDITETLTAMGVPQRVFHFTLTSTSFDTNFRPRHYNVRSVKDESGKDLSFVHSKGSMIVGLPKPLAPNASTKIRILLDGNILFRPSGDARWQLPVGPWFPQPDLNGQYYTLHSVVKVKKPFIAFAPGVTVRTAEEGEYNIVENRLDKPVQFAVVHAGKYTVNEKTYDDGLTVRVAAYALPKADQMEKLNTLAWKMIKFYETWLGPYPFKEFNIIEINELGFGQAPAGTMFITKEAFNPLMGEDNKFMSRFANHIFAHEIAHQYWGHVVKMGSREEQWVTEAFAEYSSSLAIKQLKGESGYKSMVGDWRANMKDSAEQSSIALANRLGGAARQDLLYNKGAYLLAVLHKQLGDDKFLTFMRSLQGFFQWKYLTTSDMARLLNRIDPSRNYDEFFDKYFWGTAVPEMPKG